MRLGAIQVRELLSHGSNYITDKQIQEALWHYYYDVDKSVAYLRKEYMAKPKKEQKKAIGGSRFSFSYICTRDELGEMNTQPKVGFELLSAICSLINHFTKTICS